MLNIRYQGNFRCSANHLPLLTQARRRNRCSCHRLARRHACRPGDPFRVADQPLEVVMAVTTEEADRLLSRLEEEKVHLFYVKTPVEFGALGEPTP